MIEVRYSARFFKSARGLPPLERRKLAQLIVLFRTKPFHPLLHTKPLSGDLSGFYSFRITRDWRVIFQFLDPELIFLVDVGNRRDVYRP